MREPPSSVSVPDVTALPPRPLPPLADLELMVVTPLFGGGVETGVVDPQQPIRAAAIRGQLRFWWRTCNAARFESLTALQREERCLWGSATKQKDDTTGPAAIGMWVSVEADQPETVFTYQTRFRVWRRNDDGTEAGAGVSYALFPFQPQQDPPRPARHSWHIVPAATHTGAARRHPERADAGGMSTSGRTGAVGLDRLRWSRFAHAARLRLAAVHGEWSRRHYPTFGS